jgi:glycosyltransferase involved in cell wall biosynthesis
MAGPLLSVCLITYNHAEYIEQAIEGVLAQEVDFDWEFIIADDKSTDGTSDIVRRFAGEHPGLIRPIINEKNLGGAANFVQLLEAATGKYIAYFEGDDYWTDPLKLSKQVSFLESNPEYAICFHPVEKHFEGTDRLPVRTNIGQPATSEFEDLASENFIYTASCCFRRGLFDKFPDWYLSAPMGDWVLHLLNAHHGKIGYLDDVMAVYRVHEKGIWSMRPPEEKTRRLREVFEKCLDEFRPRGERQFRRLISQTFSDDCFHLYNSGAYAEFRRAYINYVTNVRPLNARTVAALTLRYLASFFRR